MSYRAFKVGDKVRAVGDLAATRFLYSCSTQMIKLRDKKTTLRVVGVLEGGNRIAVRDPDNDKWAWHFRSCDLVSEKPTGFKLFLQIAEQTVGEGK